SCRRCRKGVDHGSDGPAKLVPIDEQSNHEIVHTLRLGEANRATHSSFDPHPKIEVFALDSLRVLLPLCSVIIPSASFWTITLAARIIVRESNPAVEGHLGHDTIYALAPSCAASCWHAAHTAGRCRPFPVPLSASSSGTRSGKPLPAQTACPVPGASYQAPTCP